MKPFHGGDWEFINSPYSTSLGKYICLSLKILASEVIPENISFSFNYIKYGENYAKTCLDHYFWAPIPFQWCQNMSGSGAGWNLSGDSLEIFRILSTHIKPLGSCYTPWKH